MPRLQFKNFSDLSFIQSIDKPRYFKPLLEPHEEYFARQGLQIAELKNNDRTDQQLRSVFTQPDEEMPRDLLEALYVLDDLADETGHDRILAEMERMGARTDANPLPDDLNPGEFAIAVYLRKPDLIRICHEKSIYRKIKNYQEYQAANNKALTFSVARAKRNDLEKAMAPWFKSKNRSSACEIYIYEEEDEIKFQITHGRPYRTDASFDKTLRRSRVAYRPQKHDSVVYDRRTRVLKINAQTAQEKDLYRKKFGEVIFGDVDHFPGGNIYSLRPLERKQPDLRIPAGIESVRLSEVWIEMIDGLLQISKAYDLFKTIKDRQRPNLAEGSIIRASFLIKYMSGGRPRKLEVRPSNVAIYDRDRDGAPAEAFMRTNGFLLVKPDGKPTS